MPTLTIRNKSLASSGTINIDFSTNNFSTISQTGNISFGFVNTTGKLFSNHVIIVNGNPLYNITIPETWISTNNISPDSSLKNRIDISYVKGLTYYSVVKSPISDVISPILNSINVLPYNLNQIVLAYNEALATNTISNSVFSVSGKSVSSVLVSENKVIVTVTVPFAFGDNSTINYTAPSSNGIEDISGNDAISFVSGVITIPNHSLVDTFTRADSTSVVGMPDLGGAYIQNTGVWGIISNKLYCSSAITTGTAVENIISNNHGTVPNQIIKVDITWATLSSGIKSVIGLITRYNDINNFMFLALSRDQNTNSVAIQLYKRVAGTYYLIVGVSTAGTISDIMGGSTQTYAFKAYNNTYTFYKDGVVFGGINNYIDNSISTGNGGAIRLLSGIGYSGNLDRFDNLYIDPS